MNFLLLIFACLKQPPIDHITARQFFQGAEDCVEALKVQMAQVGCEEMRYTQATELDIMFRCHRKDNKRGPFWDNYIFRVSPASLVYAGDPRGYEIIREHTICVDKAVRVEAYPPDKRVK